MKTSHSARKPAVWILRKASTRISISMPHRLTRKDTFRLLWFFCFISLYLYPLRRNGSARISLRGLRRLILVNTLRRVNYVGFLVERLIYLSTFLAFLQLTVPNWQTAQWHTTIAGSAYWSESTDKTHLSRSSRKPKYGLCVIYLPRSACAVRAC